MPSKKKQPARTTRRKYQSVSFPWEIYNFVKDRAAENCTSVNAVVNSIIRKQMGCNTKPVQSVTHSRNRVTK